MSALSEHATQAQLTSTQKLLLQDAFWDWFDKHQEDKIVSLGLFIVKVTVRVKHVRPLFVLLFGETIPA